MMVFIFNPMITLTVSTIQFTLWFLAVGWILPKRYDSLWKSLPIFAVSLVLFLLCPFLPVLSPIRLVAGFLSFAVGVQLLFRGKWYWKLLIAISIVLLMVFSELLMIPFMPPIREIPLDLQILLNLIYLFVHFTALAGLVRLFRRLQKRNRRGNITRASALFFLFPISQYVSCATWFDKAPPYVKVSVPFLCVSVILFLAADIGLLAALVRTSRAAELSARNRILQEQLAYEKEHYALLASQYADIRRMRHDIDNHLYTIRALLSDQKHEDAAQYAEKVCTAETLSPHSLPGCKNSVVSSFLLHRKEELAQRGIGTDYKMSLPESLLISDMDLICALGNLLDNAAEACEGLPSPTIMLAVVFNSPYLEIRMENPARENDSPRKRRIPELSRGLGGQILAQLAEDYDGYYSSEQVDSVYRACLFLKNETPDPAAP